MNFSEVYSLIFESCPFLSGNLYDGIVVKKLAATNTISDTGSSHQSHIAFTGKQKDFFPFLEADGYFNVGYDNKDDGLKKYFTLRIPLNIYADNVEALSGTSSPIQFESKKKIVKASVLRSRRNGQEDQVELSIKSLDDSDFIEFRKLLRVNDFFILLKKKNVLEYDLVGIKGDDKNSAKLATCTDFYKNATQTPVDLDSFACTSSENLPALKNCLVYPLADLSFLKGLNEDQIVDVLSEKLKEERRSSRGTQYYGFKYAVALSKYEKRVVDRIINKAGISEKLYSEVDKGRGVFERAAQDGKIISSKDVLSSKTDKIIEQNKASVPFPTSQIIYYGVPGCGKSHEVNKKIKSIPDYNKIRTVFHPEYTNADFIGQILPEVSINTDGHSVVEYKFNPGPFTEIVRRAYLNPDEDFFLVIEEINRGNAAAIFGDMFQLLDRLDVDENPKDVSSEHVYGKGWSSYGVDNPDINAYIRNKFVILRERPEHCSKVNGSGEDVNLRLYKSVDIKSENMTVTWREKSENGFMPKPNHLHFSANTAIRLPPNLSIYATMNTSDQNVFTLDNAFQRRWDMELVPNTCNWNDADHKNQAQLPIGDTDIRWETFRSVVNSEISGGDFFNADDKQLGLFFIEADDEKIDEKKFANKVLKYLWTDVFKRNTDKIFKVKDLSKIVEDFTGEDAFDKVFVETFVQSLKDANEKIKNK